MRLAMRATLRLSSPAWLAQPATTSSTSAAATPVRDRSPASAWASRSSGRTAESAPRTLPKGVRRASMITTSRMRAFSLLFPLWSIGCVDSGEEADLPHRPGEETPGLDLDDPVMVYEVVDGDTIEIELDGHERVRMKG